MRVLRYRVGKRSAPRPEFVIQVVGIQIPCMTMTRFGLARNRESSAGLKAPAAVVEIVSVLALWRSEYPGGADGARVVLARLLVALPAVFLRWLVRPILLCLLWLILCVRRRVRR